MTPGPQLRKLAELRKKTDRQLLGLVADSLENGLTLAKVAEAHYALGDFTPGERVYERARHICDQSRVLLPLVRALDESESRRLAQKMDRLAASLDYLARQYESPPHSACCA